MKSVILLTLLFSSIYLNGQTISFGLGSDIFAKSYHKNSNEYGKSKYYGIGGTNRSIGIGFKFKKYKKINFITFFSQTIPHGSLFLKDPKYGERRFGDQGIVDTYFLLNSLIYKTPIYKDLWYIGLGPSLNISYVRRLWDDGIVQYFYYPYHLQDISLQPYQGSVELYAKSGFYFLPGISFMIEKRFLDHLFLTATAGHQWGFVNYHEIRLNYSVDNIPRHQAISYITGTSFYYMLELKYEINWKKDRN